MFDLALIPARGGSVGVPGKNIKLLGGIPLIGWTIRAAQASGLFARVAVSTDDPAIAHAAREFEAEVPFLRPADLSTSTATTNAVLSHALAELRTAGDFAVLQPTSPFRSAAHLIAAARGFAESEAAGLVSVGPGKPLAWQRLVDERGRLRPAFASTASPSRRQDGISAVQPNGAIYLTSSSVFAEHEGLPTDDVLAFPMGTIDSIDIDSMEDFELAEAVVSSGLRAIDE
jgi:N-acylneuraminate cytidylyltransferase